MNRDRVCKYIDVWLRYIEKEDLEELERDIEMSFKEFVVECLDNLYKKYSDSVLYIPVKLDDYSDYVIAPKNGSYLLEDFLLNRLLRSVTRVIYRDDSYSIRPDSRYMHEFGEVAIDKNRVQTQLSDIKQKRKIVAHEILHGMKTSFFDGDFYRADLYYEMKEELKGIFRSEINDFVKKSSQINDAYKHCGMTYSSKLIKKKFNKYANVSLENLDEILNEVDAMEVINDDFKVFSKLGDNCYIVLKNPESSNTFITNYGFIIEKLFDKETLFMGLYIEPETFYNAFNCLFTSVFRVNFHSNLSGLEIFTQQLDKIKKNPMDTFEHVRLLNALYDFIDKRYVMDGYDDERRNKNIAQLGNNGLLEVDSERKLQPFHSLLYCDEYNDVRRKAK